MSVSDFIFLRDSTQAHIHRSILIRSHALYFLLFSILKLILQIKKQKSAPSVIAVLSRRHPNTIYSGDGDLTLQSQKEPIFVS